MDGRVRDQYCGMCREIRGTGCARVGLLRLCRLVVVVVVVVESSKAEGKRPLSHGLEITQRNENPITSRCSVDIATHRQARADERAEGARARGHAQKHLDDVRATALDVFAPVPARARQPQRGDACA